MQRLCVPMRPDGGQRDRLWAACEQRWRHLLPDVDISIGDSSGEFNRSAARNAAATGDWDVAVFADADIMVATSGQVRAAVDRARETGRMVFAHTWRAGLGEAATERVLAGADPARAPRDEWDRNTLSGCYAIARPLWDAVGGYDERFEGWGFEDLAFMRACGAIGGVDRVAGTIIHLWHERSRAWQEEGPHHAANEALWHRYLEAGADPDAMRAVLP